jgi:DNA-binding beta-propeller fold protein YncE
MTLGYMYDLADTTGSIHESPGDVWYDSEAKEVYVVGYGVVRIFTDTGMETFSFRLDPAMGFPIGVAALESGDLLVLARRDGLTHLVRCNFRGDAIGEVALTGVPPDFAAGFNPNAIRHAGGKTYLADFDRLKVLVVDDRGQHLASRDLARIVDVEPTKGDGLTGFSVARDGTMLFTIATLFRVYAVAPDDSVRYWGKAGGAPGKFNVLKGVVADDRGRFYVLDGLKSAVIAFDSGLNFLGEFGYRGKAPGSLTFPTGIAFGDGRIYVAQSGDRGVAVFNIVD